MAAVHSTRYVTQVFIGRLASSLERLYDGTLRYRNQLDFGKVTEINFSLPKSTYKITIKRFIIFFPL
jgi:hypothetical protein